jgi:hypothetical protein
VTTWTQLQADVIAWTDRTDISTKISQFVGIFEDRLRRNLRVSQMEQPFSGTINSSNEIAKPSGWLAFRALWPSDFPAQQLTPQSLESVVSKDKASGVPTIYAPKAGAVMFDGSGDVSKLWTMGRVLGFIWVDGSDASLNAMQVESGHATKEKQELK